MQISHIYKLEKSIEQLGNDRVTYITWLMLRFYANIVAFLKHLINKRPVGKRASEKYGINVVMSITSFPKRIKMLPIVLTCIYNQTILPDKFLLWLADEQFPNKDWVKRKLSRFIELGLEIRFCDDIRSHKKYYYSFKENPDSIVVTYDDDIICPEDMLEKLILTYKKNEACIVCHRAHFIKILDGKPLPYSQWGYRAKNQSGPSYSLCPTGGAGCLYPPKSLSKHVFDKAQIQELCPLADDIWLKCMSVIVKTNVVLTGTNNPEIFDILGGKKNSLANENVSMNLNDKQLKQVSDYYKIDWSLLEA